MQPRLQDNVNFRNLMRYTVDFNEDIIKDRYKEID